ncbi:MAG: PAS domain S-box protein [Deltaproteobacteria bacterium]|nr:PAS domain S-box protein [Candidatus Zymogenaceae bacterium]
MSRGKRRDDFKITVDILGQYLEIMGVMILGLNRAGDIVFINQKGEEILGYNKKELLGSNWIKNYVPKRLRKEVTTIFREVMAEKRDVKGYYENPVVVKTSEERIIRWNNTVLRDEGGEIIGSLSSGEDVTERKKVENALKGSEEKYRTLFETMVQGVVYHDKKGRVVSVNPAAEEILGETLEQMKNKTSLDAAGFRMFYEDGSELPEDKHPAIVALKEGREIKDVVLGVYNPRRMETVWINIHAIPLFRLSEKKPYMVYTTIEDITEKRKVREDLAREKTFINALIDSLPGTFYVFDDRGRFIQWNKTLEDVSGYTGEEIMKMEPVGFYSEEESRMLTEKIQQVFQGEKAFAEVDFITKSGGTIPFLLTGARAVIDDKTYIVGIGIDQSERKETQKVLDEYQRMLSTLMSNIPGIVYRCKNDHDWTMLFLSDGCKRITGYDPRDLIENRTFSFKDILHPDDRDDVWNQVQQAVDEERPYKIEYRIITKAGKERWVWEQGVGTPMEGTGEVLLEGIINDITDSKKILEELRASEEKYRILIENAGEAIIVSQDNLVQYVNPKTCEISGYSKEELISRSVVYFVHPEDQERVYNDRVEKLKKGENFNGYEFRALDKSGETIWARASSVTIEWNGRPAELNFLSDITLSKMAEDELRESEERYRSLVENINDLIFSLDASGHLTYLSPVFERILKYRIDEVIGKDFVKYIHPDDVSGLLESFERTLKGTVEPHEFRLVDKDGSLLYVRTSSRTLYKDGELVGMTGVMSDISDRKKMQEKLIQTEKLSSLGGILSGVAHELNNPLAAIIGYAQLLSEKEIPEDIRSYVDVIIRQSKRTAGIIKSLLTFAREHKPLRKMIDINAVIEESYKLREYELRTNDIDLKLDLKGDLPKTFADPYQLQQVFINMINNAHDALRKRGGGSLIVRSFQQDMKIVIQFIDDGPGIPKKYIGKIFDPFFTTKEVGQGTGLGLSIVYGILEEHGGDISVDSTLGKGTTFTIELPIIQIQEPLVAEKNKRPKKPDRPYSILVVEDEDPLRKFISEALKEEGYDTKTSKDGEEAIDMIENNEFDAVVTDIKMPGLSGQNLYTYIQKYHKDIGNKVLFITGDILGEETRYFFKITGTRFLTKPFELNELFAQLGELLDQPDQPF